MAEVPHFDLPFRYENGRAAVVEQDSVDDVAACVEAVLRTSPGERDEHPEFGVADPTFTQLPLDIDSIVEQVQAWEPRASMLAEERPDLLDTALTNVRLSVDTQED